MLRRTGLVDIQQSQPQERMGFNISMMITRLRMAQRLAPLISIYPGAAIQMQAAANMTMLKRRSAPVRLRLITLMLNLSSVYGWTPMMQPSIRAITGIYGYIQRVERNSMVITELRG